ncbi:methylenetetrahydrofolate reductase [NAD(P)H] [Aureimonas sp. OT7]|uniref:Methylenetetrahydrofolate reductase n=1 Tax=Aureimonas altamirensis TaxID=370622 RepID=A0A0B1Q5R6_9HYPH|nr:MULTISPECIES: methylenetetrahydrofolate reductase [NAD(P)H] [Aureimonas]KHJ56183.1 5,10-methylenetetrahydrofolate reductase [Aureimonas altamirensis]QOG08331.1 methylenetetrahydrofolate reductase [NAD(P)H] [Aureimonas sp. OT7]
MSATSSAQRSNLRVSFEFFPPKTPAMEETLWSSVQRLAPLEPSFVSVTYGAGGSTRERTHQTVKRILEETHLAPAAHLTCVDASKDEVDEVVRQYRNTGVRHFVALRGDSQAGAGAAFVARPDGYRNGAELTAGLKAIDPSFEISVSAYPEKHPESPDFATDIDLLKRKVDNGASRAITQFFFDNDTYERYVERVRRAGIYVPIVPGIVPIHDFTKIRRFCSAIGASIPTWLAERFEGLENDPQTRAHVAAAVCAEQVLDLTRRGISDFHFYTMNRADLVYSICHILGMRPRSEAAPASGEAAA